MYQRAISYFKLKLSILQQNRVECNSCFSSVIIYCQIGIHLTLVCVDHYEPQIEFVCSSEFLECTTEVEKASWTLSRLKVVQH